MAGGDEEAFCSSVDMASTNHVAAARPTPAPLRQPPSTPRAMRIGRSRAATDPCPSIFAAAAKHLAPVSSTPPAPPSRLPQQQQQQHSSAAPPAQLQPLRVSAALASKAAAAAALRGAPGSTAPSSSTSMLSPLDERRDGCKRLGPCPEGNNLTRVRRPGATKLNASTLSHMQVVP